jgi:CheY-specific phosphatase CheX
VGVKFFGQFLIDQGEVDASDVREALALMDRENETIGGLAVRHGYMQASDVVRVHAEQRVRDLSFGDLAVEMGLLAPQQLVDVLHRQRACRLSIGQALVRLGRIPADRLGAMLDAHKADQSQYDVALRTLPDGLASHPVSRSVIDLLPRFLLRVARIHAKVGDIDVFEQVPDFAEMRVSVPMRGARGLEVALVADVELAEAVAQATGGLSPADLDQEMVADGVGEFLNVLVGHAASALARGGHRVEIGPPDYEAEPCHGWSVEVAASVGRMAMVLSPL